MRLLGPPSVPEQAAARTAWFIRLRWFAAAGVPVLAAAGHLFLGLEFPLAPFVLIGAGIALYNTVFLLLSRRSQLGDKWSDRFATDQVVLDIVALTVLMHFGGGIENPFIPYYLFHTIIAAILLPWRSVLLQVLFASACLAALAIAEFTDVLHHQHIVGLLPNELYDPASGSCSLISNWKVVLVTIFAFTTTLFVTAFLAASIAQRLHGREKELGQANEALAEQDRLKSQYVMRVAHDLAGPAGMITSCLQLVTQGLTGPIPDKALDMTQRAQRKSEYLGHLIKDLLSLSAIKAATEIPKARVELGDIVSKVFEDVQRHAAEKNLTLAQDLPEALPAVYGNADAIHELFGNLVTNAVKYTLVDGRVDIGASCNGRDVLVKVQDDGVGIPAEALPHIFEEFYRADNVRAEAVEGTGLGLPIVEQILNAHGGRIWIESEEGKGTTVTFALPMDRSLHE